MQEDDQPLAKLHDGGGAEALLLGGEPPHRRWWPPLVVPLGDRRPASIVAGRGGHAQDPEPAAAMPMSRPRPSIRMNSPAPASMARSASSPRADSTPASRTAKPPGEYRDGGEGARRQGRPEGHGERRRDARAEDALGEGEHQDEDRARARA